LADQSVRLGGILPPHYSRTNQLKQLRKAFPRKRPTQLRRAFPRKRAAPGKRPMGETIGRAKSEARVVQINEN
jgi:hypothetical protein